MSSVTRMLEAIELGDPRAADELLPVVYDELRKLAMYRIAKEAPGNTLQPTALVHEAYLQLVGDDDPGGEGRAHFFGAAAEAMRRILIERARDNRRVKRGGDRKRIELETTDLTVDDVPDEVLELDEALAKLEATEPGKAELVKLRFFCGLSVAEAAKLLGISTATADRHWAHARTWLFDEMGRD